MTPSFSTQLATLCHANFRMVMAKTRDAARGSRLLLGTVSLFSVTYLLLGYFLFYRGMDYLGQIPAIGALANERILYMLYFFFFVMLVFSNAVIAYASLFRNRTTQWLLTLPVHHRAIFSYCLIETLVISSWGLIFLSAPLLFAYGQLQGAPWTFYLKSTFAYLPFVVVPAAAASWVLLGVVRFLNKWWLIGTAVVLAFLLIRTIVSTTDALEAGSTTGLSITLAFNQVLDHTRISTNPLFPSTWMTDMLQQWSRPRGSSAGAFSLLLLVSYALMASMVTLSIASGGFYNTWVRSVQRRATLAVRTGTKKTSTRGLIEKHWRKPGTKPLLGISRSMSALLLKDIRTFRREPSQWGQVALVVGLLFIYAINLGRTGNGYYDSPFWLAVISYLNLGICCLALSTITTRFVFPQFSLEGQRLWIIGLSPFSLNKVLLQKFLLGLIVTGVITLFLILVSSLSLELSLPRIAYFMSAVFLMSITLTALSVGLGTLFPNFRETNPAKIVSGFGGVLCLLVSFVYIAMAIACLILPEIREIAALSKDTDSDEALNTVKPIGLIALLALSISVGAPVFFLAHKRIKNLEI